MLVFGKISGFYLYGVSGKQCGLSERVTSCSIHKFCSAGCRGRIRDVEAGRNIKLTQALGKFGTSGHDVLELLFGETQHDSSRVLHGRV